MEKVQREKDDIPKATMVSLTPNDCKKLRAISPKDQVTDGIRIAMKESEQYRRELIAISEARKSQNEY